MNRSERAQRGQEALRLRSEGRTYAQVAKQLGLRDAKAAMRACEQGTKSQAAPSPPVETDERSALLASAALFEAMARDKAVGARERVQAGAEARKARQRISQIDAAAKQAEADDFESADLQWVTKRLEGYRRADYLALLEALAGAPEDVRQRVLVATHFAEPPELDADDMEVADAV